MSRKTKRNRRAAAETLTARPVAAKPIVRNTWLRWLAVGSAMVATVAWIALQVLSDRTPHTATQLSVAAPDLPASDVKKALEYVGSSACASCHANETSRWKGSDHFRAMAEPTPSSVLGDFKDAKFSYGKVISTFFTRGDSYWVRTDGPDGKLAEFPVKYTFGYKPLQQYLIELPGGRLQALSITWDARPKDQGGQRWFHQYPGQNIKAGDTLHWTGRDQNWNFQCAACHSTNLVKNYDRSTRTYDTKYSEITVGCEACHGPASAHIDWAQKKPIAAAVTPTKGFSASLKDSAGTWQFEPGRPIARYTGATPKSAEMNACWSCHSRRGQIAEPLGHGQPFLDVHRPALLEAGLYHADGQQHGEVFTWGSFVQSRMYRAGVTCGNCHDAHSGQLKSEGNGVCLQCHQAETFDSPTHHHHTAQSAGAKCVGCHMPPTTYMGVDTRHDHSFKVPRPDQSVAFQSPNACNGCHTDKTPQWASASVRAWFPAHRIDWLVPEVLAGAARRAPGYEASLSALIDDPATVSLVRATAIAQLPPELKRRSVAAIERAVSDSDPVVRAAALRQARTFSEPDRIRLAVPRLSDKVRLVRIEAAHAAADISATQLGATAAALRDNAVGEAIAAELAQSERPESLMNLATLYATIGRTDQAEAVLKEALAIDPSLVAVRINLADLYRQLGRDDDGEQLLREAIKLAPQAPDAPHALALLLVRGQRGKEALPLLQTSFKLAPNNVRYGYVYAVALNSFGNPVAAIDVLTRLNKMAPDDRAVLQALAAIERDRGNTTASAAALTRLQALDDR